MSGLRLSTLILRILVGTCFVVLAVIVWILICILWAIAWVQRMAEMSCWLKGVTCYEMQLGTVGVRWCYLSGEYWRWRPWRRLSFHHWPEELQGDAES